MNKQLDRNGKLVRIGDTIEFMSSPIRYEVIERDGKLGCVEDGEFIPLQAIIRNFIIVNRK